MNIPNRSLRGVSALQLTNQPTVIDNILRCFEESLVKALAMKTDRAYIPLRQAITVDFTNAPYITLNSF